MSTNKPDLSSLNQPDLDVEALQRKLQTLLPDAPYYCYGNGSSAATTKTDAKNN